jgi:hypothetical protein
MRNLRHEQKRDVYLTGFGKFGDILENPTTFIVQEIKDDANITEAKVLEVSAKGKLCLIIEKIYALKYDPGALEMIAPMREKAEVLSIFHSSYI